NYAVSARTREIGVRIALGARPSEILTLILRHGTALVGTGVVIGLLGAMALARFLKSLLFGVAPFDPVTFAVVAAALLASGLVASYLPAHRAARVDPVCSLRQE